MRNWPPCSAPPGSSQRDQVLIHTGLNPGWRRGPVHERSELRAIKPAPLHGGGKVIAQGNIWERTVASGNRACHTLLPCPY